MAHRPGSALVPYRTPFRLLPAALALVLGVLLALAVLDLPEVYPGLAATVADHMGESGVDNPVAAVLLNFRAWDTLLEVGVLVLAVLGAFSLKPTVWRTVGQVPALAESIVLGALGRLLVPAMLLAGPYLLWAGTKTAGGAFQGAAVVAAAGVLLLIAGMARPEALNRPLVRVVAVGGFAVFLAVGLLVMPFGFAFLDYPPHLAYGLVFGIEAALTVSIGAILALLYAGAAEAPPDTGGPNEGARG
jgi:multisubunit Na+/H+ antiporter MnhB subunit